MKYLALILFLISSLAFAQQDDYTRNRAQDQAQKVCFNDGGTEKCVDVVENVIDKKNYIINGNFDFSQRGSEFTSITNWDYGIDRWWMYKSGSTNVTWSRTTANLPVGSEYALKIRQSDTVESSIYSGQSFETKDIIPLQGKVMTWSFKYKNLANCTNQWRARVEWGTSVDLQDPTGGDVLDETYFDNSASWANYSVTFTIPDTAKGLRLDINTPNNIVNGCEIHVAQMMLNEGSIAAPFRRAGGTIGGELALAQRYCWGMREDEPETNNNHFAVGRQNSINDWVGLINFPVEMRTAPTFYWSSPGHFIINTTAGDADVTGYTSDINTKHSSYMRLSTGNATVGEVNFLALDNGDGGWFYFEAEL